MSDSLRVPAFEPLRLLEDEPAEDPSSDELALGPFAQVIAEAAVGTNGPFTIGVFADWGLGKTSALRLARSYVRFGNRGVVTAWFNAWQYERDEHPIIPLVASIITAIEERRGDAEEPAALALSKVSRALRAVAYGFAGKGKVAIPGFGEIEAGFVAKEMVDRYDKLESASDPLLDRSLYYQAFDLLHSLAREDVGGADRPKIVVFIDDLDRCMPDRAINLLESIKLVLAQPGFIFVLGVDRKVLEGYLEKRYVESYGISDYGRGGGQYLDKIVQLAFPLPPHASRFERYVERTVDKRLRHIDPQAADVLGKLTPLLAVASNESPRAFIRLLNNLLVDQRIHGLLVQESEATTPETFLAYCAVSRSLQMHLGHLYRQLIRDGELCQLLASLGDRALDEISQKDVARSERAKASGREKIMDRLRDHASLLALFRTPGAPAHEWLSEPSVRRAVDGFLTEQREETSEDPSQREIFEAALRTALGLEGDVITPVQRAGVRRLDLARTSLDDEGVRAIEQLPDLRELDLSWTAVTRAGLGSLRQLTKLETLHLSGLAIGDDDVALLAGLTQLRSLDVADTELTREGVARLAKFDGLESLSLAWCGIGDDEIGLLSTLRGLRKLNISYTHATDACLVALKDLRHLENLNVGGWVTDDGLAHIGGLRTLETLWLAESTVTDDGLAALSDLERLDTLDIDDTRVSEAGLRHLRRCPLELVFASRSGIRRASALAEIETLSQVFLRGSPCDDVEELARLRPDLRIE